MDKIILASVNRVKKGETFLESVSMDGPGSQALLVRLLSQRNVFTQRPGFCFFHDPAMTIEEMAALQIPKGRAAIGVTNSHVYLAVPFAKARLENSLVRSARTLRMLRHPVRLITDAQDLVVQNEPEQTDPRFKD